MGRMSEMKEILSQFININNQDYSFEKISSGHINQTFFVLDHSKKAKFILQEINTSIFKSPGSIMNNISKYSKVIEGNHLEYSSVKFFPLLEDSEKYFYSDSEEKCWRLMNFIPNSVVHNSTERKSVAFEAGSVIGKFHRICQSEDMNSYEEILKDFNKLSFRLWQYEEALKNADKEKIESVKKELEFVNEYKSFFDELYAEGLPLRLTHNDTKLNNILFEKGTDKGLTLIDLDTLMPGYLVYDFGDAIRLLCNTADEDEKDISKVKFKIDLFDSFTSGYLSHTKDWITEKELKHLPYGILLFPFMIGLRFLTDYLNGNIYFHSDYLEHNLIRARTQFTYFKEIMKQFDQVKNIVLKYAK